MSDGTSRSDVRQSSPRVIRLAAAGLMVSGLLLRVFRFSRWPLEENEVFTLRDSLFNFSLSGPKPLIFALNHYFVAPWHALDEAGLRLLPVIFGIAAIPALYLLVRRAFDDTSALLIAFLVTVSPWHLYWSQFARYYSLVFLLTGVASLAVYIGVTERKGGWIGASLALWPLAVLAHPSASLVLGGLFVWALGVVALRAYNSGEYRKRHVYVIASVAIILVVATTWKLAPVLQYWFERAHSWGHGPLALFLSYADSATLSVMVLAGAGMVWLFRNEQTVAWFVACGAGIPLMAGAVLTTAMPISTGYLFATYPLVLLAGAVLLAALWQKARPGGLSFIALAVILSLVVADAGPKVVSHYMDGGRPDIRAAAEFLERKAADGDVVLSDQHKVTLHYLDEDLPVSPFGRTEQPPDRVIADAPHPSEEEVRSPSERRLWIVVEIRRRGGFNELGLGRSADWIHRRCWQRASFGRPRLDYKVNRVEVYECPRGA